LIIHSVTVSEVSGRPLKAVRNLENKCITFIQNRILSEHATDGKEKG
jgi:hypothetical protein